VPLAHAKMEVIDKKYVIIVLVSLFKLSIKGFCYNSNGYAACACINGFTGTYCSTKTTTSTTTTTTTTTLASTTTPVPTTTTPVPTTTTQVPTTTTPLIITTVPVITIPTTIVIA